MKFYQYGRSFFGKMVQIRRCFATMCTIRGTRGAKVQVDATFSESLERGLDKVVSRGEKNFSVHKKYMNFFQYRKTALDEPLYKLSAGRSMVEMLGILAIIGVLSVGAIAGYSKAMMKYKLNKHAEAVNMLLNNSIQISARLPKSTAPGARIYYVETLAKINLLPDGIRYDETTNRLVDNFGNKISFFSQEGYGYEWALSFSLENSSASFEQCQNLIKIAKTFSAELLTVIRENSGSAGFYDRVLLGDNKCTKGRPCLKNLTLDNIAKLCSQNKKSDNTRYGFHFFW